MKCVNCNTEFDDRDFGQGNRRRCVLCSREWRKFYNNKRRQRVRNLEKCQKYYRYMYDTMRSII